MRTRVSGSANKQQMRRKNKGETIEDSLRTLSLTQANSWKDGNHKIRNARS